MYRIDKRIRLERVRDPKCDIVNIKWSQFMQGVGYGFGLKSIEGGRRCGIDGTTKDECLGVLHVEMARTVPEKRGSHWLVVVYATSPKLASVLLENVISKELTCIPHICIQMRTIRKQRKDVDPPRPTARKRPNVEVANYPYCAREATFLLPQVLSQFGLVRSVHSPASSRTVRPRSRRCCICNKVSLLSEGQGPQSKMPNDLRCVDSAEKLPTLA